MKFPTDQLAALCIVLFLSITFVISVIEKFSDWKGTVSYISEIFRNTFLNPIVKPLMLLLVGLEIISCYFLVVGLFQLIFYSNTENALMGCLFSIASILSMLIGQRIAKDYQGATSLGIYFLIAVFGVFLLN